MVLLRHDGLVVALDIVCWSTRNYAAAGHGGAVVASHAVEVLLLSGSGGDGSSLGLGLMGLQLALLMDYMMCLVLLMVLRPVAGVLLLVLVNVLHWRARGLRCRAGRCGKWFASRDLSG